MKYKIAKHRGSLVECLKTEKTLKKEYAEKLLRTKIVWRYCYDERIHSERYLINYSVINSNIDEIECDEVLKKAIDTIKGYDWLNIYFI